MSTVDLTRLPSADPTRVYRYRDGLYAADLVTAAFVHLDFFTWLAANPSDFVGICRHFGFAERPADVMMTLFAANGFVRNETGVFRASDVALEHLVAGSPWSLKPYYASLKDRPIVKDYLKVLTTGRPANWGGYDKANDWHKSMEDETFARGFTAAMDCRGVLLGPAIARKVDLKRFSRLLDIGGGSGIYACALVANNPQLTATVFDQPSVEKIATTRIAELGMAGRVTVKAGDMLNEPLPSGCDLHLYSNVLHDWDVAEVRQLLAASFRALKPGGMLLIHDAFINADKAGPLPVAEYSALLMHSTQGKCYSTGEYETLATEAGFRGFTFATTAADRGVMTAGRPS